MELKLALAKSDFTLSEDREMTVTVTNRTSATVEIPDPFHSDNWQPVYTITGPSYPQGYSFSFRSVALNDKRPEPKGVSAVTVKIAPGQKLEKDVPIAEWAPIRDAGEYQIVARLHWKDLAAESAPVRFRVGAQRALVPSVGVDVAQENTAGEWVEWFIPNAAGRQLYTGLFERPHVDMHGYRPFSISPLTQAGPDATDLLSPWTNYNRMSELAKWRAWREGSAIVAFALGQGASQRLDLGAVPRMLVRPALMTSKGELDVFATASDGALLLARFSNFRGDSSSAHVLWRSPAPHSPIAARAALSSETLGSQRRVLLVSQDGKDLVVDYMNATDGAKPGSWVNARIPKGTAIPDTQPAMRVHTDSSAYAAVPFLNDTGHFAIADFHFTPEGRLENAKTTEFEIPEAPPQAAAASYTISATGSMRRDWVALLKNEQVIFSAKPKPSRRLTAAPALPLQLILLDSGTYLLTIDPSGTPGFTLLD